MSCAAVQQCNSSAAELQQYLCSLCAVSEYLCRAAGRPVLEKGGTTLHVAVGVSNDITTGWRVDLSQTSGNRWWSA